MSKFEIYDRFSHLNDTDAGREAWAAPLLG